MINDKKIYKIIKSGRISNKDFLTLYEYATNNNLYEYVVSTNLSEEEKTSFITHFNSRLEFESFRTKRAIRLFEEDEDTFLQTIIKEKWEVANIFQILESFYYNELKIKELLCHKGKNEETFFSTYVKNIKFDLADFRDTFFQKDPMMFINFYDELLKENKNLNSENISRVKEMIGTNITSNFVIFLSSLFKLETEEGKKTIEKIFGDINKNFSKYIFEFAAIHPELVASNLYKILGWGFDPNLVSEEYNETLPIMVINNIGAYEIIDFLKICIKYNYDVNDPTLMSKIEQIRYDYYASTEEDEDEYVYDLYELLCANNFDTYKSPLYPDESYKKTYKFFAYRMIIDGLRNNIGPLELEENFETKLYDVFDDIYDLINGIVKFSGYLYLGAFMNILSAEIIKIRNESLVVSNNNVTVRELLDCLMSLLYNNVTAINNKIEDIKVKKLNY